ncbi:LysR family transcriptional regulator [Bariatricus sp. SGI.154]|uniref:LysR family transcriptional regulator n=1 Tax=Bariatricus sp. SGI.154 TaxID=3420549 RepID=UPI003CFF8CE3
MTRLEIEAFLMTIQCGSISAASEKLYVTQPALSRRLRALEEELGYPLLIRNKGIRSITLTEEGQAFVAVAEKLKHIYREAEAISNLKQNPILNLASIGSVSTYVLPNVLRQIISDETQYNLCFHQYHSFESYGYVESGLVDIALISDDMYSKNVSTIPAFQEPFVLVGGSSWDHVSRIHPSELDPRQEIRLPWNPEFDNWHEKWFDVTIYPKVQLDQMSLLEEFLTGDHYAIVPLLVARKLKGGNLNICELDSGPEDEIIYYLTCGTKKKEMIEHFLHLLHKELIQTDGVKSFLA